MKWPSLFSRTSRPNRPRIEPRGELRPAPLPPWPDDHFIAGNCAVGNLRDNLFQALHDERGVHAETLMAVIGAITGYASAHAALARADEMRREARVPEAHALMLLVMKTGRVHLLGNDINEFLFERWDGYAATALALGVAASAGVPLDGLPGHTAMASQVAHDLGKPDFGTLKLPEGHNIGQSCVDLLRNVWPLACRILLLPPPHRPDGEPLPEQHWPYAAGWAGALLMERILAVLNPALAASIFVQSAFYCAKVDPDTIDPGRWELTPGHGRVIVERLTPWPGRDTVSSPWKPTSA